jgi:hypothetical protein
LEFDTVVVRETKMKIMGTEPYPPPPPPPPPPPQSPAKRSKMWIALIIIVVLIVVSLAAAYILMASPANNNGNDGSSASPSPSATASASPTTTPLVTATPSPSGSSSAGYRVGAWANYTMKNYDGAGGVTALYNIRYSVNEGMNKGVDCWLLQTVMEFSSGESTSKTITTYWLDKSTLQGVHYKIEIYSGDTLISLTENDYSPGDVNDIPTAINPNVSVGQETITVPAGTFNCIKAATTKTDLGNEYVITTWGNSNVPVVGMVKQTMTSNGALIMSTELNAYGG